MAPTTRSALATTTTTTDPEAGGNDSPSATPRKVPHCTKCKRPRAGHPRSGCPYVASPSATTSTNDSPNRPDTSAPVTPRTGRKKIIPGNITDAMDSMHIRSSPLQESAEEMKNTVRTRRRQSQAAAMPLKVSESLLSLSSFSNEIVEKLLQPGILDDDTEPEDGDVKPSSTNGEGNSTRIIQWQETLVPATAATPGRPSRSGPNVKSSLRSPMPGTLVTPNTSFFESSTSILKEEPKINVTCPTEASFSSAASIPKAPPLHRAKPLARSMSMEQRQTFISRLGDASKATIYILPKADIHDVAEAARDLGFYASLVMNDNDLDEQALLVLGRDEMAVEKLLARVQEAEDAKLRSSAPSFANASPEKPRSRASALGVAAGGAVVGAVGTWAGLAFA